MGRWTSYNQNLKFLQAKLEGLLQSDKEWPHFKLTTWNKDEWEKVICESCNYIEGEMTWIEVQETEWEGKKMQKVIIILTDDEWNQIKWRIWYWTTVRKVLQKLSAPKEIWKVRFSCWRFAMEKDGKNISGNYVTVTVDWQKYDDPFDYEKDILPKRRAIKDPETWEFVKFNDSELEKRVLEDLVSTIHDKLKVMKNSSSEEPQDDVEELDAPWED